MESKQALNETNPSSEVNDELIEGFDNVSNEEKLGLLFHETAFLMDKLDKELDELSLNQLKRVLLRVLKYPLEFPSSPVQEVEITASVTAAKIEHFKLLTLNIANDIEQNGGNNNESENKG